MRMKFRHDGNRTLVQLYIQPVHSDMPLRHTSIGRYSKTTTPLCPIIH